MTNTHEKAGFEPAFFLVRYYVVAYYWANLI